VGAEQWMDGERKVIEPTKKMQRIAMGTFADVDRLDLTLQELVASAVHPGQLCIIGCVPSMKVLKTVSGVPPPSHVQALLDRPRTIATLGNGAQLMAAPETFDGVDFGREREPQGLLHGLEQMLLDGALALLVMTRTIAEFAAVTRLLLRHSSHHVRTREVADPSA
jgi:hypothetical protein